MLVLPRFNEAARGQLYSIAKSQVIVSVTTLRLTSKGCYYSTQGHRKLLSPDVPLTGLPVPAF